MKKKLLYGCLAVVMVFAMAFVAMPERWAGKADENGLYRGWFGFMFKNYAVSIIPSDATTLKAKSELEMAISAADPAYNRDAVIKTQSAVRSMQKTATSAGTQLNGVVGYNSLERLVSTGGYRYSMTPSSQPTPSIPSATPTTQPTQQPTAQPTPSATPTPTPTIPDPVTPVQHNTPTNYYFASSGDQWQEVWYNTSSLMYLRGSVPADCDTSRTDCWQLSFDLDGETVTVQGNGCTDWRGTSLDVSFNFDDDLINEVESYFIKGGDNVPVTFRYYAGNTLKKASVAGQPKLMLTYDGWLKLYVTK